MSNESMIEIMNIRTKGDIYILIVEGWRRCRSYIPGILDAKSRLLVRSQALR
jgi:hypothetical protein